MLLFFLHVWDRSSGSCMRESCLEILPFVSMPWFLCNDVAKMLACENTEL